MVQRRSSWRGWLLGGRRCVPYKAISTAQAYHLACASPELLHGCLRPVFVIVLLRIRLVGLTMLKNAAVRAEHLCQLAEVAQALQDTRVLTTLDSGLISPNYLRLRTK